MELNREQIKKALECCTSSNSVSACMRGCPIYEKEDCECINDDTALLKYALSLVKELTEENERLREELAKSYKALDEQMNFYCSFTKSKVSDCPINDEIVKAKADTAREIFGEFRNEMRSEITRNEALFAEDEDDFYEGRNDAFRTAINCLAKLKKKYTEEKK